MRELAERVNAAVGLGWLTGTPGKLAAAGGKDVGVQASGHSGRITITPDLTEKAVPARVT